PYPVFLIVEIPVLQLAIDNRPRRPFDIRKRSVDNGPRDHFGTYRPQVLLDQAGRQSLVEKHLGKENAKLIAALIVRGEFVVDQPHRLGAGAQLRADEEIPWHGVIEAGYDIESGR